MKTLLLVLSAAGLTGCAVYPEPAYGPYGYGGYGNVAPAPVVVAPPPVYIYGSGVYRAGGVSARLPAPLRSAAAQVLCAARATARHARAASGAGRA